MSLESDGLETCSREKDVAPQFLAIRVCVHALTKTFISSPRSKGLKFKKKIIEEELLCSQTISNDLPITVREQAIRVYRPMKLVFEVSQLRRFK